MHFFLLRDVFVSLKCWLDLWLSNLVDCIHIYVFLLFKKLFLSSSIALQQISTDNYLSSPLDFFSRQILMHLRSIEVSRFLLDRCSTASSIHQETFCLADRFSIHRGWLLLDSSLTASRSVEDLLACPFFNMFCIFLTNDAWLPVRD